MDAYQAVGVTVTQPEPLVEREIFNRAEAVTANRSPVRKRATEPPYLLGGVARCDVCGR